MNFKKPPIDKKLTQKLEKRFQQHAMMLEKGKVRLRKGEEMLLMRNSNLERQRPNKNPLQFPEINPT